MRTITMLGIALLSALSAHAAELAAVPLEPPPLDGGRAPSSPLVPWLAANGLYGYADRSGAVQIPPRFIVARPFYEGFAAVSVKDYGWGFIQPSGAFQIAPRYAQVTDFLDGEAKAYTHREPIMLPLGVTVGAALVSGSTTEYRIDRRGVELKKYSRSENVLQQPGPKERRFARYPEPLHGADKAGWHEELLIGGGVALRRGSDGRQIAWARWMRIVRDAASGAPVLFAGHDDGKPWSIWDLNGKLIASSLSDVFEYAGDGRFCAQGGSDLRWAAFDLSGHRLTPYFGQEAFLFRDGIAEVLATQGAKVDVDADGNHNLLGAWIYVDTSGRLYAQ
jgi:hypothetical protein